MNFARLGSRRNIVVLVFIFTIGLTYIGLSVLIWVRAMPGTNDFDRVTQRTGSSMLEAELARRQASDLQDARGAERALKETVQRQSLELAELMKRLAAATSNQQSKILVGEIAAMKELLNTVSRQYSEVNTKVSTVSDRLKKIEDVVIADPSKALALQVIQRDQTVLAQQFDREIASLKLQSERVYDLTKWIVSISGVVTFGLIGIAVLNVFKRETSS